MKGQSVYLKKECPHVQINYFSSLKAISATQTVFEKYVLQLLNHFLNAFPRITQNMVPNQPSILYILQHQCTVCPKQSYVSQKQSRKVKKFHLTRHLWPYQFLITTEKHLSERNKFCYNEIDICRGEEIFETPPMAFRATS